MLRLSALRTLVFGLIAALCLPAMAADETIGNMTKKELDAYIKDFLFNNPQVITDSMKYMREQEMKDMKLRAEKALERNKKNLENDPSSPSVGDASKADVTVVEFFDYHCGYCKHMLPVVKKIMEEDPKVRFVFKDLPILSEDSMAAAKAAMAVWTINPDKYFDYHTALMKHKGRFDENMLLDTAARLGMSKGEVRAAMASEKVKDALRANRDIAMDMEIRGTPAFVIGDSFLPGAIDEDMMKQAIEATRKGKKINLQEPTNLPE